MAPQRGDGGSRNHVQRLCIPLRGGDVHCRKLVEAGRILYVRWQARTNRSYARCTSHNFLGATMLAFFESLVDIVSTGITAFVGAVVDLIK